MFDSITLALSYGFFKSALLAALFASVGLGALGAHIVARKISYITGGIAHAALGGVGLALYFRFDPVWGILGASVIAALVIGLISARGRETSDTLISIVWAVGMSIGIIFSAKAAGYQVDLMSYLFGNILLISSADLKLMVALDIFMLVSVVALYPVFLLSAFDRDLARLRGVNVALADTFLYILIALTVTTLIKVVGLILVITLLTIPATIAARYSNSMAQTMIGAILIGALVSVGGILVSFQTDLPSSATIALLASAIYFLSTLAPVSAPRR